MYEPGVELSEVFEQNVAFLERLGAVASRAIGSGPGASREPVEFLAEFLRPYLEAYRLAAETAQALLDDASRHHVDRRALVKRCLERGRADPADGSHGDPRGALQGHA